jgi:hypothetical protein
VSPLTILALNSGDCYADGWPLTWGRVASCVDADQKS